MSARANLAEIRRALALIVEPGSVVELRMLHTKRGTVSGYFKDPEKLAAVAARLSGNAPGVYVTLNPLRRELLARACNRTVEYARTTAGDGDVIARRWLPIDFDPVRPSGISATEAEHAAALDRARACRDRLRDELEFPAASLVLADSGNGGHVLVRIDLENDETSQLLIERSLAAVAFQFDDAEVCVDLKVGNTARIWKLYGTLAAKGDATIERPHRLARVIEAPGTLVIAPREVLERLAARAPKAEERLGRRRAGGGDFDLERWLSEHERDLHIVRSGPWNGGRRWVLSPCPWNAEHTNGAAYIVQHAGGAISAGCHHNGCAGKNWHALRDLVEPGWRERRDRTRTRSPRAEVVRDQGGNDGPHLTDLGNARRLVRDHGADLRYCAKLGGWFVWDDRRWALDESGEVMRRAKQTAVAMLTEAANMADDHERRQLVQWAMRSQAVDRIRAMVKLAETEPGIPVKVEEFDRDPFLLNVLSGTINLRTGVLRKHRREDLLTKLAPVTYDSAAACPTFDAFLARIQPAKEMRVLLMKAAGYSLTGDTRERVMFIFHGPGDNGKTTLVEAWRYIWGEYAMQTPTETLMVKRDGAIPNDLARLRGARLVTASESEEGKRLAEALVKDITGKGTITARFMHCEWFEYVPAFKLFLSTNHKPVIRGTDKAIWNRIKLVPFAVTIPKVEQNLTLVEKLQGEAPGILRWAVAGCLAWQRDGLQVPEAVQAATTECQNEMDVLGGFIEDACAVGPALEETAKALYAGYLKWCELNSEKPMTKKAFGLRLAERGFVPEKKGARRWKGIKLLDALGDGTRLDTFSQVEPSREQQEEESRNSRPNTSGAETRPAGGSDGAVGNDPDEHEEGRIP